MKKGFFDNSLFKSNVKSANVKIKEMLLGYFVGPFLALISNAIFASYLNRYYADVFNWNSTPAYGAFSIILPLVSSILIIIGNIVIGNLMDKIKTSQGKARPLLLLSVPLICFSIALMFLVPIDAEPMVQMIWIAVSYNLYYAISYPLFYTGNASMVSLSTRNSKQRGLLATFSNASGVAAVGIGASMIVPFFLESWLFPQTSALVNGELQTITDSQLAFEHWRIFMIVLVCVTFVGILLEYYNTRERITEENIKLNIKEEKISIIKQLKAVTSSKDWWIIILYFFIFQLGGQVKNGSMTFYCQYLFTDTIGSGEAMGMLGLIGGIPTAIGMVLAWPIASKLGKSKSMYIGLALSVLGGLVSFINPHDFLIAAIGVVLKGIGSIPAMYVSLALLSDVLDHLEAKNGFRSDGLTMAIYGAIMVGMTGIANSIINSLLSSINGDLASKQNIAIFCYLGFELICYAVLVVILIFLNVEKNVEKDHLIIKQRQKELVEARGEVYIEPEERMRLEQEEADRLAEEARINELKEHCKKKNLSFEEEEAKYQAKIRKRQEFFNKFKKNVDK